MESRYVVLDTETTGLKVRDGHRVIEIACIEMIGRQLTGNHFHAYLNPGRAVEAGALAIHGITDDFLKDKPNFREIEKEFIAFIEEAELIIHNAPFDLEFLNNELKLTQQTGKSVTDYCMGIIDTLPLARQRHTGQRNDLDALCKRYRVDCSQRTLHGAMLDVNLLAQVYLAMTGGQGSFFDNQDNPRAAAAHATQAAIPLQKHSLIIQKASPTEIAEHELYLLDILPDSLWKSIP